VMGRTVRLAGEEGGKGVESWEGEGGFI